MSEREELDRRLEAALDKRDRDAIEIKMQSYPDSGVKLVEVVKRNNRADLAKQGRGPIDSRDFFDRLTKVRNPISDSEEVFAIADIRTHASIVINLEGGGLLAVIEHDHVHVSFGVFNFVLDGQKGDSYWASVFHGSGPSSSLRELRHTYWGEPDNAGYIFYPNAKLIGDAFKQLQRWFDCNG